MIDFLKDAAAEALVRLLYDKSPDDITIHDIIKNVDISKRSCYYTFHDVFSLLDELYIKQAESIPDFNEDFTINERLKFAFQFVFQNESMSRNVYNSSARPIIVSFLNKAAHKAIYDTEYSANKFVADYHRNAIVGVIGEWLENINDDANITEDLAKML